jgi:glycolate oxidase FAD binding subunit
MMDDAAKREETVADFIPPPARADAEQVEKFATAARSVVSAEHVLAAGVKDEFARARPQVVVRPATEQELVAVLRLANEAGLAVSPRGGGTKMKWGDQPKQADVILSLERLNRVIEHAWADLTVTVEAGCTLRALQQTLAKHGQRLALDALWPEQATVGGVLSTNDSGVLRLRFGGLRDFVIGMTVALADGTLAKSGGKVVKNVAGYDLPKLMTGAFGTLGVITRAVFRLHPVAVQSRSFTIRAGDFAEAQEVMLGIQDSQLAHSALQMRYADGGSSEVDVLFEATGAGLAGQIERLKAMFASADIVEADASVWQARQRLFDDAERRPSYVILKISTLPADIAKTMEYFAGASGNTEFAAVVQATGLGHYALWGEESSVMMAEFSFMPTIEQGGGSMMIQQRSQAILPVATWRCARPVFALCEAMKRQFDPRGTLNPGRFVGQI